MAIELFATLNPLMREPCERPGHPTERCGFDALPARVFELGELRHLLVGRYLIIKSRRVPFVFPLRAFRRPRAADGKLDAFLGVAAHRNRRSARKRGTSTGEGAALAPAIAIGGDEGDSADL